MHMPYTALLQKEWIKLRHILWIVPAFFIYATADTYFTLNTIERVHEAFGLWTTIVSKEPPFFGAFQYSVFLGFIIAFFQIWPETQGKHLRLLFHMPVDPARMIGFMLAMGLILLSCINVLAVGVLLGTLWLFNLPWEIFSGVLCAFAPFAILNYVSYMTVFAFCGTKKWGLQGLTILSCLVFYSLLWGISGYNAWREAILWYAVVACGFVFVCFFTFLQSMGEPEKSSLFTVSRVGSLLLFALLCSMILPGQYWRVFMPKSASQRLYYSPVHDQFVRDQTFIDPDRLQPSKTIYSLEDETVLKDKAIALALPTMYGENLLKWNMFPKEINGQKLTLQQIKYDWQYFSLSPRTINKPPLLLEMMLEAQPDGASLEAPIDVFRLAHDKMGIEFLRPEDGSINKEKSAIFTQALQDQGFVFPVQAFGGNPNIRKVYDAGYVFVDAKGHVFQLQMVQGKAYCRRVQGHIAEDVRFILVDENRRKEFFAYAITDSKVYAVQHKPLSLVLLPLPGYTLANGYFYMWADPLQKTFVQGSHAQRELGITGRAFLPNFTSLREYTLPMRPEDVQKRDFYDTIAAIVFPWRIVQRSPATMYYTFEVQTSQNMFLSVFANIVCVLVLLLLQRRKPKKIFDIVFVGIFGMSGLLILGMEAFSSRWRKDAVQ